MLTEKENLKLLDERISSMNLEKHIVLAFDFDELAVPINLTKEITKKMSKPTDEKLLAKLGACSFEGIRYLNSLIYGYKFGEYKKIRDKIAKETKWTKGFDAALTILMKDFSVIFVSSGMKDICEAKLKETEINSKNIIASEFKINKNIIVNSQIIISDTLKGYIINEIKRSHIVIAIGHSLGDKAMLDNANISISISSKIPNLARLNVNSFEELLSVIKNLV